MFCPQANTDSSNLVVTGGQFLCHKVGVGLIVAAEPQGQQLGAPIGGHVACRGLVVASPAITGDASPKLRTFQKKGSVVSEARDQSSIRLGIREIAMDRPRFGYLRMLFMLRREGSEIGKKRV